MPNTKKPTKPTTLVLSSKNKKTGDVAATYASIESTCPESCALKSEGTCYAMGGRVAMTVRRLDSAGATAIEAAENEAEQIDAVKYVPGGKPMRVHVSGDCATDESAKILGAALSRWVARGGGQPWTYTHAWRSVSRESWGESVSILASCDTAAQAMEATAKGWVPATVVPEFQGPKTFEAGGVKWLPCQEQTRGIPCVECKLCMREGDLRAKGYGIAFAAHGMRKGALKRRLEVVS